jgi:putative inorganic carbon (hco3(-)) transporter
VHAWRLRSPLTPLVAASAALSIAVGAISGAQPKLGLLAAIGVVFVALVLTNLRIGFAAMVMFAYLEVLSVLGGVSLAKVAGALIVVAWIAVVSVGGKRERNLFAAHPAFTYAVLLFLVWNAISVTWSDSPSEALTSVMRYGLNAFLLPIAYTAVRSRRDAIRILAAIVVGATIAALSAIASPPPPESAIYGRAAGTVGDPNELAAALLVGLAIAVAFAANRHIGAAYRALAGCSAALCLAGILISLSRGGLLGVAAAMVIAILVGGRWRARVLALAGVLAVLAVGYFAFVASLPAKQRVLDVGAEGGTGRLDLWTVGLRMIEAHPLNGIGSGQFPISSVHYLLRPGLIQSGAFILSTPKVAHNTYLNVTAELGLVGGVLFVGLIAFCIGCALVAIRRVKRAEDECMEILLRGFVVAIGGYLVTLLFLSESTAKLFWILLGLGPALLAVASAIERSSKRRSGEVALE